MRSSFYRYKTEFQYTLRKLAVTPLTPPHQLHLATYCGRDKIAKITGGGGEQWRHAFFNRCLEKALLRDRNTERVCSSS